LLGYEADWVPRERVAALFWPERHAPAARANLRKVLHELRALGVQGLEDTAAGLRWAPDSDVGRFRSAWALGQWQAAADADAGPLMPQLDEGPQPPALVDWLRTERQQWHGRWREAVLKAAAEGDARRAWQLAERLLAVDALDEDAMALALRAGAVLKRPDRTQALWERHVDALGRELGTLPSPALQRLAAEAAGAAGALQPLSPLVGREAELEALCAMLAGARLVTVFGPGGVGKSRLARHAADRVAPRFARGVVLVALDDALAPAELPPRVAAALGREQLLLAARACLARDNVVLGATVAITAARLQAGRPEAGRWLHALVHLPGVQEPVRLQAVALARPLAGAAPGRAAAGAPALGHLHALLADIVTTLAPSVETHPKRPAP
jgi:DNA-binding SARP family transcriptional activator